MCSNRVDATKCLRHQHINVEEATAGQTQRRNMFLFNVHKQAKIKKERGIRSFMQVTQMKKRNGEHDRRSEKMAIYSKVLNPCARHA